MCDKICVYSFPVDKFATAVSMKKLLEYINASLEEGKLLFNEKLANEKSIDSTDDLARRKIIRFS